MTDKDQIQEEVVAEAGGMVVPPAIAIEVVNKRYNVNVCASYLLEKLKKEMNSFDF